MRRSEEAKKRRSEEAKKRRSEEAKKRRIQRAKRPNTKARKKLEESSHHILFLWNWYNRWNRVFYVVCCFTDEKGVDLCELEPTFRIRGSELHDFLVVLHAFRCFSIVVWWAKSESKTNAKTPKKFQRFFFWKKNNFVESQKSTNFLAMNKGEG